MGKQTCAPQSLSQLWELDVSAAVGSSASLDQRQILRTFVYFRLVPPESMARLRTLKIQVRKVGKSVQFNPNPQIYDLVTRGL